MLNLVILSMQTNRIYWREETFGRILCDTSAKSMSNASMRKSSYGNRKSVTTSVGEAVDILLNIGDEIFVGILAG